MIGYGKTQKLCGNFQVYYAEKYIDYAENTLDYVEI